MDTRTPLRIRRGPSREGVLSIGNRPLDFSFVSKRDLPLHLARAGIENRAQAPRLSGHGLTGDKVTDVTL
jgi:hypothetical protein